MRIAAAILTFLQFPVPTSDAHALGAKDGNTYGYLSGTMALAPVCAVERFDHPCTPTATMYAVHPVLVYRPDKKTLVIILTPDGRGHFSAQLPAGDYWVDVQHQPIGPVQGVPAMVHIAAGTETRTVIRIDTGLR